MRVVKSAIRMVLTACVVSAAAACDRVAPGDGAPADTSLLGRLTTAPRGVDVHLIRMVPSGDSFAFEPAEVRIRSGDLVRFVMVSSLPQSVSFELSDLSEEAAGFVREQDLQHGTLLTSSGETYDVSFRDAPPGSYRFRSVVHAERGMRGVVIVDGDTAGS
jgi:plastocyanin